MTKTTQPDKNHILEFKGFLSFLILHELSTKPLCGEDLAIKIGRRKGTRLTPGTIYPALKELRRQKLVRYRKSGRRKIYTLREEGNQELERQHILFARYFWGLKNIITKERMKRSEELLGK
ncbi:MAG: PadR family transcriptional regulator [Candidatus Woesearchaeota archaeon]